MSHVSLQSFDYGGEVLFEWSKLSNLKTSCQCIDNTVLRLDDTNCEWLIWIIANPDLEEGYLMIEENIFKCYLVRVSLLLPPLFNAFPSLTEISVSTKKMKCN